MAITRVGSPTYASGGTALAVANPQTPTAGNLLVLTVGVTVSFGAGTCSVPAGYTQAGAAVDAISGASHLTLFQFWKLAVGGDAAPSMTVNSTGGQCVLEEFTGGFNASPFDAYGTGATTTAASGTLTAAVTTTNATDWIYTSYITDAASPAVTFGGGSTLDSTAAGLPSVGTQSVSSTGTKSPTVSWTSGNMTAVVSTAFKTTNTTQSGVVPMVAVAGLSSAGVDTQLPSTPMVAAASLSAAGTDETSQSVPLAAVASLITVGVDTTSQAASMIAVAALGLAGVAATNVPMAAIAALSLAGADSLSSTATLRATAVLSITGVTFATVSYLKPVAPDGGGGLIQISSPFQIDPSILPTSSGGRTFAFFTS